MTKASKTKDIIGGTTTSITSAPWMAQLWSKILTAAHCVKGFDWHANGAVLTGTDQLPTTGTTDLHGGTVSGVWRQWNHPSYDATTIDDDIAVLALPSPIRATPIRRTTSTDTASYAAGTSAKVYGWGRTSSTSDVIAQTLRTATLPIQSDSTCSGAYGSDFVAGHMVRAGNPATGSDSGTTATCNGDSGGPLIVNNRIVGIVSWGSFSGCNTILQTDLDRDGYQDFVLRRSSDGAVFWLHYVPATQSWSKKEIAGNWSTRKFTVAPGDVTGDYLPDLLSVDSSGILWVYPGRGDGTFAARVEVGSGWGQYNSLRGHGDFDGDGKADLIAHRSGTDDVYLYRGTGKATSEIFATRISVGTGFQAYDIWG